MNVKTAYKAVMSTGSDIPLDPDELEVVMRGAAQGALIRIKQGVINPSFLVSITEDKERRDKFLDDTKHEPGKRALGMQSLKDIFSTQEIKMLRTK